MDNFLHSTALNGPKISDAAKLLEFLILNGTEYLQTIFYVIDVSYEYTNI